MAVATRQAPASEKRCVRTPMKITPRAMLSRAVGVIRNKTLIVNLPGRPKACMECLDSIMDTLPHAFDLLRNEVEDCAKQ
jgi:molybdopterin biosynthesis enzyme MoaB